MAKEIIASEVKLETGQAEQSIVNIKKELKAANQELIAAQRNFGDYSNEALAAAKRVAELKDAIGEAKETADLFDPGNKLKVLGGVLNTAAAGFSTLTSATALFGSESEELEKTLLKVQSAMALSQGVSTILDSGKDFARLGAIIRTNVVSAFSTLRGAIISTGIGALVVAIGLIIANFEEFQKVMEKIFPGFGKFISFIKEGIQAITDFVGITSEAERQLEALNEATELANDGLNRRIKVLEATGGKEAEIFEARRQIILNELKALQAAEKTKDGLDAEQKKKKADLLTDLQVLAINYNKNLAKQEEERTKKEQEEQKKRNEDYKKKLQERAEFEKAQNEELEKIRQKRRQILDNDIITDAEAQAQRDAEEAERRANEEKAQDERNAAFIGKFGKRAEQAIAIVRQTGDAQAELNKKVIYSEEEKYNAFATLANQAADLVGRQTVAGKAFAIANATIATYQAANSALKADYGIFGPAAQIARFVAVAATVANGIRNVKAIAAVQVPGGGGGGNVPNIQTSAAAPLAPQAQFQQTRLDQQQINQIGAATVRAYVVQTEINSAQEREIRVQKAARIN